MKKLILFALFTTIISFDICAQLRVTSDGMVQVDYTDDEAITFGDNPNPSYLTGRWAIEYWTGGLNFWIPYPNTGYSNYKLFLEDATGYVGINEDNPAYHLDVNGDIATFGTLRISSDKRFKTNINSLGNTIDKVKMLEGVSYKMKQTRKKEYDTEKINDPDKLKMIEAEMAFYEDSVPEVERFGFIAQDLKEVFPELVDQDEKGYLNIDYIGLIPVLVEAIKELETRIETIENDCCNNLKSNSLLKNGSDSGLSGAKLYQNSPNPFDVQTTIRFEIPETVQNAQLYICNMTGTLLKTLTLNQRGMGSIIINANEFVAGMYLYSLVTDRIIIDTKQMLLTE